MTWAELERKLKKESKCRLNEHLKGHDEWINPETGEPFLMERHRSQQVPKGLLHKILKAAGLK